MVNKMLSRKYKSLLLILLILSLFIIQMVDAKKNNLKSITITIDPGHGGVGLIQKLMVML